MRCPKCNDLIKSDLNITFCRICGEKIEQNNNELDKELLSKKIEEYILNKEYDLAFEYAYNLENSIEKYTKIIEIYDLYLKDNSNVTNNFVFKKEYILDAYRKALSYDSSNEVLLKSYDDFVDNYLKELNNSIESLNKGINQKKIELEKLNSMSHKEKLPYFNKILIACIITIVSGIILGFVIQNKIANIIGYVISAIGVIVTIIVAYITPSYDYLHEKDKIEHQLKNNKEEIHEVEKLIDEIKK